MLRLKRQARGRRPPRSRVAARPEPPKTEKGRRTRDRLLRAAGIAVGKYGYPSLRIDQIAAEADVPVGLFYRYFRSKRDVILEVLHVLLEEFRASIPQAGDVPFWHRELALHRNFVLLFGQGKTGMLSCYFSDSYGEAAFRAFFAAQTHRFIEEHSAAVLAALGRPRVREPELHALALALVSMTENFLYRFFTGREHLSTLPGAQSIDFVWLLAAMRQRGFLLLDPPRPHVVELLRFRRPADQRRPSREPRLRRVSSRAAAFPPKRVDAQASLARVRQATLHLLSSLGYDDLRIEDIEQETGVTRGVIYYHFADKRELIHSVLLDRLDQLTARLLALQRGWSAQQSPYLTLLSIAVTMTEELSPTPGLLRAIYVMEERDQEFAREYRERRAAQIGIIADAIAGHLSLTEADTQALEFMAAAFLAMAERFLFDVYVARLPDTAPIETPRDAAELLAALWHRMAFVANPPARETALMRTLRKLDASRSA